MAILGKEPQFKEEVFQYCSEDCIDFIKQCLIKDADMRPSIQDLLRHPWLNQYDNMMQSVDSFTENYGRVSQLKGQAGESIMDRQTAAEFTQLLFTKMSWVSNSQETVVRLAEVFRQINVTGSHHLTKLEFYQGLADNFGDMGFNEAEWESMFELMDTNQDD